MNGLFGTREYSSIFILIKDLSKCLSLKLPLQTPDGNKNIEPWTKLSGSYKKKWKIIKFQFDL